MYPNLQIEALLWTSVVATVSFVFELHGFLAQTVDDSDDLVRTAIIFVGGMCLLSEH